MRTKASGESTLLLVDAVQVLRAAQLEGFWRSRCVDVGSWT
jgi:hypothetical protein